MKIRAITLLAFSIVSTVSYAEDTLISPMVGGLDVCPSAISKGINSAYEAAKYCESINETSSTLLEKKLSEFGNKVSPDGRFQVGYTIGFPLLSYVNMNDDGSYSLDKNKIKFRLKLLKDTNRQAIVYLFSNHFSVTNNAETENKIAKADKSSLMELSNGTSPIDGYFSSKTYPWAINAKSALIDKVRKDVITEIMSQICSLSDKDREKIRAVTVLGEVHYTYPDFFNGMGYNNKFEITDYSPSGVKRFQGYLKDKYKDITNLNKEMGSKFSSFEEIYPPAKDINKEKLDNYFQHIDYASSGELAIYGWAAKKNGDPVKIKIFVDGVDNGYAEYGLNRMDVYQQKPELGRSSVGYRYFLDITKLEPGIHRVDVVRDNNGKLTLMKSIDVPVMDRSQSAPKVISTGLKLADEKEILYWNDYPETMKPVYYNPLSAEFYNFRKASVAAEIKNYAELVGSSCIDKSKVFSHQIAPMFNGDWNLEKTAVTDSLKKNESYNIGFNTYGSAFYGDVTFDWLKKNNISRYGIPEAHAMVSSQKVITEAFDKHHAQGALFISPYYIEIQPDNFGVDKEHAKFKIEKDNTQYYSSSMFNAIKNIMASE